MIYAYLESCFYSLYLPFILNLFNNETKYNSINFFESNKIHEILKNLQNILKPLNIQGIEGGGPNPNSPNPLDIIFLLEEDSDKSPRESFLSNLELELELELEKYLRLEKYKTVQECKMKNSSQDSKIEKAFLLFWKEIPKGINFYFTDHLIKIIESNGQKEIFFKEFDNWIYYDSVLHLDSKINCNNSKIELFNKEEFSKEWSYLLNYFHHSYIEGNIFTFISQGLLVNESIEKITPNRFLAENLINLHSLLSELDRLLKAKLFYEKILVSKNINHLIDCEKLNTFNSTLKSIGIDCFYKNTYFEYWEAFYKYTLRQIFFFNIHINECNGEEYITNMLNIDNVYEELLENTLFVYLKILETKWTINKITNDYSLVDLKKIKNPSQLITFYNELYKEFVIEIKEKYSNYYYFLRCLWQKKLQVYSHKQCLDIFNNLKIQSNYLDFNAELNEETLYKKKVLPSSFTL